MSELDRRFERAVAQVRNAPSRGDCKPSNELPWKRVAWYRQVTGKRPGLPAPVGRIKYDAWAAERGMDRTEAMPRYPQEVEAIAVRYG